MRLLRCALRLASLLAVSCLPLRAQVLRVAAGDRELGRAEASTLFGHLAYPITLLAHLGADVRASRAEVVVRLFGDTLRFRPGRAAFELNRHTESLHSWTYQEDDVLFVAEWFFTHWLPHRYAGSLTYRDGILRVAAPRPAVAEARPVPVGDSVGATARRQPTGGERPIPAPRRDAEDGPRGMLLGFIDARVSGVFDSNIDHDPLPQPSYGTIARLGVGIQSAPARPALVARYDLALHRFTNTDEWNRVTHDVSVEVAPSLSGVRLRLGAALRLGAWTEDRQAANQLILRPRIEIRPAPAHVFSLYAVHSARQVAVGTEARSDTFRLAGVGYYLWWRGGGLLIDGRYEMNRSEYEGSRYAGWTGYGWMRIPLAASHRLTLETAYNRRWYDQSFVDQTGTVVRTDQRWTHAVSLTKELGRTPWAVGVEYEFEHNESNDASAVYRANRVEVSLRRQW